jgi:S-adenosylmethionine hydrolase
MIVMFTDFGVSGPYLGQMQAVLSQQAPDTTVINLFADAPTSNPRAAAYLLPAYVDEFPEGSVFLCVVDPGVGSDRRPVILNIDGRWFVGPDNGLFNMVALRARNSAGIEWWDITWQPDTLSNSFHGRDLFAPVAAMLARGDMPAAQQQDAAQRIESTWPEQLNEIIYIDHFGNAMTGVQASRVTKDKELLIHKHRIPYARTFAEVPSGESFWYENANGLVELATNQGRACDVLSLTIGDSVVIE